MHLPTLVAVLLAATAVATPAAAQQASAPGRIVGVVTAPDGARLPGASVRITHPASGSSVTVVTANHGGYSGSNLPPGDYDVEAASAGFQAQVARGVAVRSEASIEVNFTLPLSTVTETVTVQGALVKDSIESTGIRDANVRDIGEALSRLNGLSLVRKGAIANDIVLQGHQSRNLTVLIDGERIYGACPNGMDPAVFHADFAEVDHLEIAKGPFDVRHQGSLGGLVNVVTRAPGPGLHASPNFSSGSWGYINPSAVVSWGTPRLSALAGYSYRSADPYRDGSGALFTSYANYRSSAVDSQAFDIDTGWGRVYFSPSPGHSAQAAYTRQQANHVLYPYLLMDGLTDNADRFSASYAIARDGARVKAVSVRAYYSAVEHYMTDALRVSSATAAREYSMATEANTATTGGNVEVVIGGATAGVEAFRREWDATTVMAGSKYVPQYSIPFATTDHVGVFTDYERLLASRTTLAAGGRLDYSRSAADAAKANTDLYFAFHGTRSVSASDTGASGKLRVAHQVTPSFDIQVGVGHTLRVPDPMERYFALKRMGNDWVGNPALQPTRNTGLQAGANYRYGRSLASVSVSRDWVWDFVTIHGQPRINMVPGVMNSVARSFSNVDARLLTGEFSLTNPFTDRLSATVRGSYTRGDKDTDPAVGITSPYLAEIPPANGSVSLRYDRAVLFVEAQGVFAASQDRVDTGLREAPTPGYGLMNLRVGGQLKKVRVTVAFDNVFNRFYVLHNSFQRDPYRTGARVPEPGRNLYASISYRF